MKVYLATPIESAYRDKKEYLGYARVIAKLLEETGHEVHKPWEVHIPNAWVLPNWEWGAAVAAEDVKAINVCDMVICICYDRNEATPGVSWELGYAYGIGKPTLIVEHESTKVMSLMFSATSTYQVRGVEGLANWLAGVDNGEYRETEVK